MKGFNTREKEKALDNWLVVELPTLRKEVGSNDNITITYIKDEKGVNNNSVFTNNLITTNPNLTIIDNKIEPDNPTEKRRPNPFSKDPLDIEKSIHDLYGSLKEHEGETLNINLVNKIINGIYKLPVGSFYGKEFKETKNQLTEILQKVDQLVEELNSNGKISDEEKEKIENLLELIGKEYTENKSNPIHEHPENLGYN